ncbi:MAG TPA: LysE family translocator [Gammaproteobacteria bacterium]
MTLTDAVTLFGVMFILALVPGISVLTVTARAAAFGFTHGAVATLGILIGDIIFIAIAIFGLSLLADTLGNLFVLIKYLGAAYLVGLGVITCQSKPATAESPANTQSSLLSSFMPGLLITLGDQKAILFYLGFLPAFIDLSSASYKEAGIVIIMAALAIGLAKLGYALMAAKAGRLINPKTSRALSITAGSIMITVGVFLAITA